MSNSRRQDSSEESARSRRGDGSDETLASTPTASVSQAGISSTLPSKSYLHIDLGFNLYQNGRQLNPNREQMDTIMSVFPTCYASSIMSPILVLRYRELPPKPWPLTIAGLPVWITKDPESLPLTIGLPGHALPIDLDVEINLWETPKKETVRKIFDELDNRGINAIRVQWLGVRFLAFVKGEPSKGWAGRFPRRVNGILITYIFGDISGSICAQRVKSPVVGDPDNSNYSPSLRPGMMISSGSGPDQTELLSTSGVCVRSPSGKKYITCASHGFPLGLERVYHPDRHGHYLGEVKEMFWDNDVSLFELNKDQPMTYSRQTFNPPGGELVRLKDPFGLHIGESIHMDTAFNGHCEGIVMVIDTVRVPSDEPVTPHRYITGIFTYLSDGSDSFTEGCCGGPVWTDGREVVGQFQFLSMDKLLCYVPSFAHLIELGYELSEIN
ncbi:MAG: hypothetical protein M1840_008122 [Geoglossum simile]|nr:MAG: hypothetical protein M1840_008122 [Geoglossum simile]